MDRQKDGWTEAFTIFPSLKLGDKNKKNIINLLSAEIAQRMVMLITVFSEEDW